MKKIITNQRQVLRSIIEGFAQAKALYKNSDAIDQQGKEDIIGMVILKCLEDRAQSEHEYMSSEWIDEYINNVA